MSASLSRAYPATTALIVVVFKGGARLEPIQYWANGRSVEQWWGPAMAHTASVMKARVDVETLLVIEPEGQMHIYEGDAALEVLGFEVQS